MDQTLDELLERCNYNEKAGNGDTVRTLMKLVTKLYTENLELRKGLCFEPHEDVDEEGVNSKIHAVVHRKVTHNLDSSVYDAIHRLGKLGVSNDVATHYIKKRFNLKDTDFISALHENERAIHRNKAIKDQSLHGAVKNLKEQIIAYRSLEHDLRDEKERHHDRHDGNIPILPSSILHVLTRTRMYAPLIADCEKYLESGKLEDIAPIIKKIPCLLRTVYNDIVFRSNDCELITKVLLMSNAEGIAHVLGFNGHAKFSTNDCARVSRALLHMTDESHESLMKHMSRLRLYEKKFPLLLSYAYGIAHNDVRKMADFVRAIYNREQLEGHLASPCNLSFWGSHSLTHRDATPLDFIWNAIREHVLPTYDEEDTSDIPSLMSWSIEELTSLLEHDHGDFIPIELFPDSPFEKCHRLLLSCVSRPNEEALKRLAMMYLGRRASECTSNETLTHWNRFSMLTMENLELLDEYLSIKYMMDPPSDDIVKEVVNEVLICLDLF